MPSKLKRTFNYAEKITMNAPAGASASYRFSCNGMYDPNRSGVGHQPMGFDQFVGVLYDHFTVIAAKITVTAMSQTTTVPQANQIMSIQIRDTSTATTPIERAIEQGRAVYGHIGSSSGSAAVLKLTHKVAPHKFLGRSHPLSDPDLKGNNTADPAEECFFEINVASQDGDDPEDLDLLVVIEYTAILTERVRLLQS